MEEIAKVIGGLIGAVLFHALLSFVNSMIQLRQGNKTATNLNNLKAEVKESHNAIAQTVDESMSGTRRDIKEAQQVMMDALSSTNAASSQVMSRQSELIDKYETRISAMEARNTDADRRYGLMKTDFEKLLEENQRAATQRKELTEQVDKLQKDSSRMQQDLSETRKKLTDAEQKLTDTQAELEKAKTRIAQLESERADTVAEKERLTKELELERGKVTELQEEVARLRQEVAGLKAKLDAKASPPPEPPKQEPTTP